MKVVSYYRVSTAEQGESGYGLEAQQNAVAALLARRGDQLISEFTEVESGRKSDRPELAKALAEARQQKAILCVAKLDRLARDVELIARLLKESSRNGFGGLLFADFPDVDPTTAEGELFINQMAAFAQFEARRISQRTKAGLAVAKARGVKLGGNRGGQEIASAAKSAKALAHVQKIEGLLLPLAEQGLSLRAIADQLNQSSVPTASGSGQWNAATVSRALKRLQLT